MVVLAVAGRMVIQPTVKEIPLLLYPLKVITAVLAVRLLLDRVEVEAVLALRVGI
jgi:hypothetical protein